jgi:small subunit ribosomal protein S13
MSPDEKSEAKEEKKGAKPEKKPEAKAGEEAPKEEEKAKFRKGKRGGGEKDDEEKEKKGAPGVKLTGKVQVERYIVRLVNTDLPGDRRVQIALQGVKGVGPRIAQYVIRAANLDPRAYIGNLNAEEFSRLEKALGSLAEVAPEFMLNRRNDWESGADTHLFGQDVEVRRTDDINLMKKIRCYKGVRHEHGLPVRGQSTRHNGRVGLTMGVIRAKAVEAAAGAAAETKKEEKKPAAAAAKKPAAEAKK